MACSCEKKAHPNGFIVTTKAGQKLPFSTKIEASAAARRTGGSYRPA